MHAYSIDKTNKRNSKFSVTSVINLVDLTASLTKDAKLHFSGTGTWILRDASIKTISHLGDLEYYINGTGRYYDHPTNPTEEISVEFEGIVHFLNSEKKEVVFVLYFPK